MFRAIHGRKSPLLKGLDLPTHWGGSIRCVPERNRGRPRRTPAVVRTGLGTVCDFREHTLVSQIRPYSYCQYVGVRGELRESPSLPLQSRTPLSTCDNK